MAETVRVTVTLSITLVERLRVFGEGSLSRGVVVADSLAQAGKMSDFVVPPTVNDWTRKLEGLVATQSAAIADMQTTLATHNRALLVAKSKIDKLEQTATTY